MNDEQKKLAVVALNMNNDLLRIVLEEIPQVNRVPFNAMVIAETIKANNELIELLSK